MTARASLPPVSNTGGNTPETPGRGGRAAAAFIDTLTVVFHESRLKGDGFFLTDEHLAALAAETVARETGVPVGEALGHGRNFYKASHTFGSDSGFTAAGGNRDTVCVHLTGVGCALVRDWRRFHGWLQSVGAHVTRVDLAHDDFSGVHSIAWALEQGDDGFKRKGVAGRPPKRKYIDDMGSGDGKTLYVGNRKNGKLLRIYEKGRELGDALSEWVRHELELRNTDQEIPLDVLINPGHYLAASYPCMAWISDVQVKIRRLKATWDISREHLVKHCRAAYGRLVNVLEGSGDDAAEIVQLLKRPGVPRRLAHVAAVLPV